MRRKSAFFTLAAGVAALAVLYACTGDDSAAPPGTTAPQDSGTPINQNDTGAVQPTNDAAPNVDSGAIPPCFSGTPTTYLEIINAYTDAQAIDKQTDLSSMNLADGGLQPLP